MTAPDGPDGPDGPDAEPAAPDGLDVEGPGLRTALGCAAASVLLLAGVAALGDSAAVPGLGPRTWHPPWDLAAHPSSALVSALLAIGYGLGAVAVWLGLRALARGARLDPRLVAAGGLAAVAVLVAVPPLGSADHLSYVAYGRIATQGGDPYAVPPADWRGGTDPVAGAVQPPWQRTPSVYGPAATAAMAAAAYGGHGSLRLTVWLWQLICGAAFLAAAAVLDALTRHDPAARTRAALLWTLNPLLLGQLVLGAHVDVLAAALALGALALALRAPLVAGALVGAAAAVKAPYALTALAILWGLRNLPLPRATRHAAYGIAGALAVLIPAYRWAGPHAFDQLSAASRMISLATPWRAIAAAVDAVLGSGATRPVVVPVALLLAAGLAALLARRVLAAPAAPHPRVTADAARAALVLTAAWLLTAPYALPWYDAMVWAPLALVWPSGLDLLLLARLTVLALAYLPGRVVGLSTPVQTLTLGVRRYAAPVAVAALLVAVVGWSRGAPGGGRRAGGTAAPPPPPAAARARP